MSVDDSFTDQIDLSETLHVREQRRAFLITYSQADLEKVPNSMRFAEIVLQAFNEGGSSRKVVQWCCCMEDHADGGKHYHLAILFSGSRRWSSIKNAVRQVHGILLHFSCQHVGYVAAYRYVIKDKSIETVLHSPEHPDIEIIKHPPTKDAMKGNSSQAKKRKLEGECSSEKQGKPPRLSNSEVCTFMVKNNIKSKNQLMCITNQRAATGENDLHSFIVNKNPKSLADLISTTWEIENAPQVFERSNKSRISVVQSYALAACSTTCNGSWLTCARELVRRNNINPYVFANVLRQCITKGLKNM